MNWFRLYSFIQFLVKSTNQYGIHSPFVYQFVIRCLYAKLSKNSRKRLKSNRKVILESDAIIEIIDKGKGSQTFTSPTRQVSKIAKRAGASWRKTKLLNKIIDYFRVNSVLELGTSVGLGTIAMATHHPKTNIQTVEACPQTYAFAKQQFEILGLKHIETINNEFQFFLDNLPDNKSYDLIYIDGHHDRQATLYYFSLLQKHIHQNSVIIFDDIYWSEDMRKAWNLICTNDKVKVSIDLYFWGIVFFNDKLTKQHFRIRKIF